MKHVQKRCIVCFKLVLVDDKEKDKPARCMRHGGTAFMQPVLDEMVAELMSTGLIRVSYKQKILGVFLPSEAEELADKLHTAVRQHKETNHGRESNDGRGSEQAGAESGREATDAGRARAEARRRSKAPGGAGSTNASGS